MELAPEQPAGDRAHSAPLPFFSLGGTINLPFSALDLCPGWTLPEPRALSCIALFVLVAERALSVLLIPANRPLNRANSPQLSVLC